MVTHSISSEIYQTLAKLLGQAAKPIALHQPMFTANEWEYTKDCIDTGWVSSVGQYVDRFEKMLVDITGAKYAVATVNGTAALHISFLLAGVRANDEVLSQSLTFVGTTNPITYCSAIPHFIETEPLHLGIDVEALDCYLKESTYINNAECINKYTGRRIKVLCAMHTFGHPARLDELVELAERYHLVLIEDAAEALGSYYKNVHVGHQGLAGILSFNGNKIATSGGGGAILTNHPIIAKQAKHITTTAKLAHPWLFQHDQVAYNYRLPNINAALGCAQLEQLPSFLKAKRALSEKYKQAFKHFPLVRYLDEPAYAKSNFWLNALQLHESVSSYRDELLALTNENGIMTRPIWNLQHTLPMFSSSPRMPLAYSERLASQIINIPSSVALGLPYVESTFP